jgi:hypothetical protein
VLAYLPTLPFDPARLRFFSADMLAQARRTIESDSDIRLPGVEF